MNECSRGFYFQTVVWGKKFRDYFINIYLASLLSPNNIPALENKKDSRFIIVTTKEDWECIQNEPLFILLKNYIDVVFVRLDVSPSISKMQMLSRGHKLAAEIMFANKAVGIWAAPELVLSDGAILALQKRLSERNAVVLCPAIRYDYVGCMREFQELGLVQPGKPLSLTSRQLMSIGLRHLHSESITWLWESPFFAHAPVCNMWQLSGKGNFILHGYSWLPLLVDYATLDVHDMSCFDVSTLDHDYIYKNFGTSDLIQVVKDSDELAVLTFTDEEDLHIPLIPNLYYQIPGINNFINKDKLRQFHYCFRHGIDPLRKKLINETVLLHSTDMMLGWEKIIKKVRRLVKSAISVKPKSHVYKSTIVFDMNRVISGYFFKKK